MITCISILKRAAWTVTLCALTALAASGQQISLIPTGAVWRYLEIGSASAPAWTLAGFNDSAWPSGPAELGYGDDVEERPEATVVGYGGNDFDKFITTYFRNSFVVPNPAAFSRLVLRLLRDDGAVVYLNGTEVFRDNMPAGPITPLTTALTSIAALGETTFSSNDIPAALLVTGTNVVAVEIHQSLGTSSDISFDLELIGFAGLTPPVITVQPVSQSMVSNGVVSLAVVAAGSTNMGFRWYSNDIPIAFTNTANRTSTLVITNIRSNADYKVVVTNAANSLGVTSSVAIVTKLADQDGDRIPDFFEAANGLNLASAADAGIDTDADGQNNLSEFLAGTNPTNAASVFRAQPTTVVAGVGSDVSLSATATNGATLVYQWRRNGLVVPGAVQPFLTLTNCAISTAGVYTVTISNFSGVATSAPATVTIQGAYTNQMAVGFNLIANHYDRGGNTLGEILPAVPAGSLFYKFNSQQSWDVEQSFVPGLGWRPGGARLNPGEGGFLFTPAATNLVFTGVQRIRQNILLPANQCQLLSMQSNAAGNFDLIVTSPPPVGATFQRWNQTNQVYSQRLTFNGTTWTPAQPTNRVGEAVRICTGTGTMTNLPPFLSPFTNLTMDAGSGVALPFIVGDLETPLASLQVLASTSNTNLLLASLAGVGNSRTLFLTNPAPELVQIPVQVTNTVFVSDLTNITLRNFVVTILPLPAFCRGSIKREIFDGILGNDNLTNLTTNPRFPGNPTSVDFLPGMASGSRGDNYGLRLSGYIIPPTTGDYRFQVSAERTARLELSRDFNPTNAVGIATQAVCCLAVESILVTNLARGSTNYIQALLRATTNDDFIEVRWLTPGGAGYETIPAAYLMTFERATTNSFFAITNHPVSQSGRLNTTASFFVGVHSNSHPVFYQWQRQGTGAEIVPFVDLPGANGPVLVISPVTTNDAARYRCVVSVPGLCLSSSNATLTLDTNPPLQRCVGSSKGTNFWLTIPGNASPDLGAVVQPYLTLLGSSGTVGMVEIVGLGFQQGFNIGASMSAVVVLTNQADLGDALDIIQDKGIHVTANADIGVIVFDDLAYTTDAYMVFPVDLLGRNHFVAAYGNRHDELPMLNGSQLAIVATANDTLVQIGLSAPVGLYGAQSNIVKLLQRGQTYQLRATNSGLLDLSGTTVDADKPIAVFAGHQCATIPSSNVFFCNYIAEQLLPTAGWGTNHYTVPLRTRSNDTYRCMAMTDGTVVRTNGVILATNLHRGEFVEFHMTNAARVSANLPVSLVQYGNSSDYDAVRRADPTMITLPSSERWLTNYMIYAPPNFTNYLNLAATTTVPVRVDGALSNLMLNAQGFGTLSFPITPGVHQLSSSFPFLATAYGFSLDAFDAYGYVAGASLPEGFPPTLTGPATYTLTVGVGCTSGVPQIPVMVIDDCALSAVLVRTQRPPAGTIVGVGIHAVTNFAIDTLGNEGRFVTMLTVRDLRPAVMRCSTNLIVECTNVAGNIVTFTNVATNACGGSVMVVCVPPSGSVFPPGTTLVTCFVSDPSVPTNQCTFLVTVRDTMPPILLCPSNVVAVSTSGGSARVSYLVTAIDTCDSNVLVVCNPPSGTLFPVGQSNVTCTATNLGTTNRASCTFPVTVLEPPLIVTAPTFIPGRFTLTFPSVTGLTYIVEYKNALTNGPWVLLTNVSGIGQTVTATDQTLSNRQSRFYRVRH